MTKSKDKLTVALIEDDKILSKSLGAELAEAGFRVVYGFDGQAGLDLITAEMPDLVLLDIVMPKLDGVSVLKALKNNPKTQEIPVIILTILDDSKKLVEAIKNGTYDYLVKADWRLEDVVKKVKEKLQVD